MRGGAVALPLPARALNAPFARAVRARGGAVLDALLAGRGWIALIGVLLAGIVFFNVDLLQMNREIARDAERISALKRDNSRLRLERARLGSSERIQEAAARLGLVLPAPGDVRYLRAGSKDARNAAARVTEPNPVAATPPLVPETTAVAPETAPQTAPVAPQPTAPAEQQPPVAEQPAPVAEQPAPVAQEPIAPAATGTPQGGTGPAG